MEAILNTLSYRSPRVADYGTLAELTQAQGFLLGIDFPMGGATAVSTPITPPGGGGGGGTDPGGEGGNTPDGGDGGVTTFDTAGDSSDGSGSSGEGSSGGGGSGAAGAGSGDTLPFTGFSALLAAAAGGVVAAGGAALRRFTRRA